MIKTDMRNRPGAMGRAIVAALMSLAALLLLAPAAALAAPELNSTSAALMDAATGQIIYEKNLDRVMHPASITKIMTMLLAVENSNPKQRITVSEEAVMSLPFGSSNIGLQPGEIVTMEEMLYAAAMMSANDACNVMAEAIAGGNDAFAAMMNARAKSIGCANTHFVNPHGLTDRSHYSSARDMALITREAMQNKDFCHYFGALNWEMGPTNIADESRQFTTQHAMLWGSSYYYEGADGGKTGYTSAALNTLVTSATRDGRHLIAVVMQSETAAQRYADTAALLDYGFDEFKTMTLPQAQLLSQEIELPSGENEHVKVKIHAEQDFSYLLHTSLEEPEIRQTIIPPEVWSDTAAAELKLTMLPGDPSMYRQLGTMPLALSVLSADTLVDRILHTGWTVIKILGRILLAIIIVAALLIVVLRARKLYKIRQRQRRARPYRG